ncbi:DUF2957 domain-containing protein [Paraburkholderia caribensis]|uniref:DUF2957 domain-containing protein n=1 Tax=Paraburkholderia caribensis TaxID=75105 RepID=UPI001CB1A92C|nr:DUF2957 domain-containing protein [Paraburkholderia caribensis]CAG9252567.1 conserved exported hypothetical protein [Paraburkholderia caribensis]
MYANSKWLACAIASVPFLIACGGGKADDPGPINANQCSGSSCGVQGPPGSTATAGTLCPADAAIGQSTYLGGAGSGEVVSLNIDAVKMTYTLKFLESPIPVSAGQVDNTRAGTTVTGAVMHPPAGMLPNAEQTRCAFMLTPASGTAPSTGATYTTPFSTTNPPIVFVGKGVAGGGIPGADVAYAGKTILTFQNVGAVTPRHFDFYPFLGFASTTTDFSKLAGNYNGLLYHIVPSGNYAAAAAQTSETFDANGACSSATNAPPANGNASPTRCLSMGDTPTLNTNGYFDSTNAPRIESQLVLPLLGARGSSSAHMILGQLNGATVPVVVRTGHVFTGTGALPLDAQVDDESGIAVLESATSLASGGFDGGYVGADSNFKYTASLIQGGLGTFINPTTQAAESGFGLGYGAGNPGLVSVIDKQGSTGYAIAGGGLYAIFINGTENGGITPSSANSDTASAPYFSVGAQISK